MDEKGKEVFEYGDEAVKRVGTWGKAVVYIVAGAVILGVCVAVFIRGC